MHVIIAAITAIAGLIWALHALQRAGVDLNSFNPFTWYRRHQWKKKFRPHLALTVRDPMDVAAVILLHTAKLKGELTRETRQMLLDIFQETFRLEENTAEELFSEASFLLKDGLFENFVSRFVQDLWGTLNTEQAQQIVLLVQKIADYDGEPNSQQRELISLLKKNTQPKPDSSW